MSTEKPRRRNFLKQESVSKATKLEMTSIKQSKENGNEQSRIPDFDSMSHARKKQVRNILRKEFLDFFVAMTSSTDAWPNISNDEFTEAIGDSLMEWGEQSGVGVAILQGMVYELQEKINEKLTGR